VKRKCPAGNIKVQLSALYTDPEHLTDTETEDSMTKIADQLKSKFLAQPHTS